jgi:hypothetical protein
MGCYNGRGTVSGDVYYFSGGGGLSKTATGKAGPLKWPIDATFVGTWYQPFENRKVHRTGIGSEK